MTAWFRQDLRLDIAIAVALEVAALRLKHAESGHDVANAEAFNQRLWQGAAALAFSAPVAEDRDGLQSSARAVASGGLTSDEVLALNIAFARRLAGRAATGGALRQILGQWRAFRTSRPRAEFGSWLLETLEARADPLPAGAALANAA